MKSVSILTFSGPYFAAFGLNMKRYYAVTYRPESFEPVKKDKRDSRLLCPSCYFLRVNLKLFQFPSYMKSKYEKLITIPTKFLFSIKTDMYCYKRSWYEAYGLR